MDFISWSVFGILFVLAESATGTLYLMAIGLAFIYPALADVAGAPAGVQFAVLIAGTLAHMFIANTLRKRKLINQPAEAPSDIGQEVEIIEWLDETTARVNYNGKEWMAEKSMSEMPSTNKGIIQNVQYGRLIIATEQA